MKNQPVLSVKELTTSFRNGGTWNPVVRKLSFEVAANEVLAVVGESGSGKSMTALSIMRQVPKENGRIEGEILLNGRNLLSVSEKQMEHTRGNEIAMIFQEPMTSLNPVLTVGYQIAESLRLHRGMNRREAQAEAVRLLDRVRIPAAKARLDEYPHRLSGGMRQRVMIATALACQPKLLIADEPTTALDVTVQDQILELIQELAAERDMGVMFITHDMGVVAQIADRVIVMYNGESVEHAAPHEIFSSPKHPYTQALLAAVPKLGSMRGRLRPLRFPVVDKLTGKSDVPLEAPDTVREKDRPLLEVKDLATRFAVRKGVLGRLAGHIHAVEGVSFDLHAGETLALVGESGCGKSTTGRTIMHLLPAFSGSVLLDGRDISRLSAKDLRIERRAMQMVFQDPYASLNPRKTVGTSIASPLIAHRLATPEQARRKAADLLERVGLDASMADRYPNEFSGGQRQRISIARALALEPKLIIADEAVSALDVSIKAQIVNLMLDLQAELGLAYLFISHDMAVVERMAHRVAVMYLGEVVEIGSRSAVFGNPQHPYTKRLLSAVPIADPSRRDEKTRAPLTELRSPVRDLSYVAEKREFRQIAPDHAVQAWVGA